MKKFYTIQTRYNCHNLDIDDIHEVRVEVALPTDKYEGHLRLRVCLKSARNKEFDIDEHLDEVIDFIRDLNEDGFLSDKGLRKNLNTVRTYFEVGAKSKLKELEEIEQKRLEEMDKWAGPPMDITTLVDEVLALHEIAEE